MSKPCMGQDIFLKPSGGSRTRGNDDWEDSRGNGRSMRGWGRSRSPKRGGGDDWDSWGGGYEKGWGKSKGSRDGKGKGGGKDSKGKGKGKRDRKPDVTSLDKELANYFGITTQEAEKKSGAGEKLDQELDAYFGKKDEEKK
eukprot:CAMPEP_0206523296 /NCGR_PEP_ID=MMETSP0324_2-20121206/67535_1 /ASSEMBLY_ACC=CAM_ASM_000836 /TAXON_ID=2866 /ORGANISM="Crypthecodinium cohnii, Strain Seligo" /LENGTH=140 /DNA_ID=CAMNT_0054017707 /DNA_START=126 /DNA_END=548 /DNA_ORIENTATION=-